MNILTDAGADLTPAQSQGLTFQSVPLTFTLDGKTYRSGIDIGPEAFYELLAGTQSFPSTSQPSPGEFADAYRRLIATGDRDVLSIHISSGLSGTLNAARLGAQEVPEANVTFVDTLTLSGAEGWVVEAAGRMNLAGWPLSRSCPSSTGSAKPPKPSTRWRRSNTWNTAAGSATSRRSWGRSWISSRSSASKKSTAPMPSTRVNAR